MTQITKNFTLAEVSASAKAKAQGIDNKIPSSLIVNAQLLATNLLQPLVNFIHACAPSGTTVHDRITSWFRCLLLNKAVGGVPSSMHRTAEATDNQFYLRRNGVKIDIAPIDVLDYLLRSGLDFDQAIIYPTFIHLSYTKKRKNRREVLYNKSYTGRRI